MKSTDLASYVASRILHDISSPFTVILAGVDSLLEPGMDDEMRAMSGQLVREGTAKLHAQLHLLRYVLGSQELNDNQASVGEIGRLLDELAKLRENRSIDWALDTQRISNRQFRLLLNMALIAFEPAGKGGTIKLEAREEGGQLHLECTAVGFDEWKPVTASSISGDVPEGGWGGGRIQPLFTKLIADEQGFVLSAGKSAAGASLTATGPLAEF